MFTHIILLGKIVSCTAIDFDYSDTFLRGVVCLSH